MLCFIIAFLVLIMNVVILVLQQRFQRHHNSLRRSPQVSLVVAFRQQDKWRQIGDAAQIRNLVVWERGTVTTIHTVLGIWSVEAIIVNNLATIGERLQTAVNVCIIRYTMHTNEFSIIKRVYCGLAFIKCRFIIL